MQNSEAEEKTAAAVKKVEASEAKQKPLAKKTARRKPAVAAVRAANIQFVGKMKKVNKTTLKTETLSKEVPAYLVDGVEKITIPKGIETGVYMEPDLAARIIALFPDDFKAVVKKGS